MRFLRNRTTAVVAGAAAIVALSATGSVAGQLIGSSDIKDDSVRSIDIHDGTIRVKDLRPGAAASLEGKDGVDGKDGKNAFSSLAAGAGYAGWPVENPHHEKWAANSYGETVQKCRAGEYVTGGGFSQAGGDATDLGGMTRGVEILVSAPYTDSYEPISEADSRFHATKWVVRGYNNTDEPVDVRAWVVCAKVN
jgi:hypothetical protein